MSKDFSCNGLRCGVLLSQNNGALLKSVKSVAMLSWPSSITQLYWTSLLNDRSFLDYYLAENSKRLSEGHKHVTDWFRGHGVKWVKGSNAGFFLWADFRGILGEDIIVNDEDQQVEAVAAERPSQVYKTSKKAKDRDEWFFGKMMKHKVYVATGDAFFAEEHGWYRVSFSVPKDVLEVGLKRMDEVMKEVLGG